MTTSVNFSSVGNSGSGKSTLARILSSNRSTAMLDLDAVAWEPHEIAVARPLDLARSDVGRFFDANEQWIVEGCYAQLISEPLSHEPHLLVLDPCVEQCTANCLARPWEPHKYASKEEQDSRLEFLLDWIRDYYGRYDDLSLFAHRKLFDQYQGPKNWLTEVPGSDFSPEALI